MDYIEFATDAETKDGTAGTIDLVSSDGQIDYRATLRKLSRLDGRTPLLIEEQYLQPRDGLGLLLRLRMETTLRASRSPAFVWS